MESLAKFMVNQQFGEQQHASIYSVYRPNIPESLAEKIVSCLKEKYEDCMDSAVDVGCGSGQSTIILSPHFKHVWGIDASTAQIREAEASRAGHNITYTAAPAEILPFAENSVQLVTAGACLHWLQRDLFFTEVRRVLVNNGIFAAYTYHSLRPLVEDLQWQSEIDSLYDKIFQELNSYWSPEVFVSLEKYKNIQFPFEEVFRIPDFRQTLDGRFDDVVGYVESLSALQNMKKADAVKAGRVLAVFSYGLRKILERSGTSTDGMLKLYRDFFITICRKIDK